MRAKLKLIPIFFLVIVFLSQGFVYCLASDSINNIFSSQVIEEEFPSEDDEFSEIISDKVISYRIGGYQNLRGASISKKARNNIKYNSKLSSLDRKLYFPKLNSILYFVCALRI